VDLEEFFAGYPGSRAIFDEVYATAVVLGPLDLRISNSQVALVDGKAFAWLWIPKKYLRGVTAPLVLTLSYRERRPWGRWKEIYQAAPRRFTHHLELWSPGEVDEAVRGWLREAWNEMRSQTGCVRD